jgi:uncharacterized protein YbbC (DUF1343 family)
MKTVVATGLDLLLQAPPKWLTHQRVGLITNASGVTRDLRSTVDALGAIGVNLVALFGPEHGFSAAAPDAAHVASERDARTGLPVYSLYGDVRKPTREMLANVDVMLFDLQDVGVRFYTFTATLALTLEACAENRVPLIVLDHPDPINGITLEGALLDPALQSFVGHGPLPIRYGMTIGELARFYNRELAIGAELDVSALQGWTRKMWHDETGLTWVPPSPGIPHFATTVVYPGMCFIEGTNLSEGRGTGLPFEIVGAPWLDGHALAEELNARRLDGVRFRPIAFTPTASKHANQVCFGVQVHVTDRDAVRAVTIGLHVIAACRAQNPNRFEFLQSSWEGRPPHFDLLTGDTNVRVALQNNQSVESIVGKWEPDLAGFFDETRRKYLLY